MPKSQRKKTWEWCSKYIRLRDAIEYFKLHPELSEPSFAPCCTCGKLVHWKKNADAGHFISRGSGGLSGVYYDERNINLQCKPCNGFHQGRTLEYEKFMRRKYGQEVVDELRVLDRTQRYRGKLLAIMHYYKYEYERLAKKYGV